MLEAKFGNDPSDNKIFLQVSTDVSLNFYLLVPGVHYKVTDT